MKTLLDIALVAGGFAVLMALWETIAWLQTRKSHAPPVIHEPPVSSTAPMGTPPAVRTPPFLYDAERAALRQLQIGAPAPPAEHPVWGYLLAAGLVWTDRELQPPAMRLTEAGRSHPTG